MRQIYVNGKWIEGIPTEGGQRFRFTDANGWSYGVYLPEPVEDMRITKRAFIHYRLSESEYVRIDLASYGQTVEASKMRRFMDMFRNSLFFDLDLESNRADLMFMESIGLLDGEGRASEILDAPILEDERWKG